MLLAYLALRPGHSHDREKVAGLFWGDSSEVQARNSLRQALAVLRRSLRPYNSLLVTPDTETIAIAREALETDVVEFERSVGQHTRGALERAVSLYDGELLDGFRPHEPLLAEWLATSVSVSRGQALPAMSMLLERMGSGA